jgi:hypothetical protein
MTTDSNPNWLVPETAEIDLESLKLAYRGTWPVADMIAADQQAALRRMVNRLDENEE